MKYCSLCNNPYSDESKNCSLSHCVSCGSTRIWSEQIRMINPLGIAVMFVFFVLIFTSLFYEIPTSTYLFMGMFGVLMGWTIQDSFKRQMIHLCLNCYAKGFAPLKNTSLQNESRENLEEPQFKEVDPDKIKNLLSIQFNTNDKKLNFGNVALIIGLVIATIGILFGKIIEEEISLGING